MQLYTLCVGWLYFEEMRAWEDLILLMFSLSIIVSQHIERNELYILAKQKNPSLNQLACVSNRWNWDLLNKYIQEKYGGIVKARIFLWWPILDQACTRKGFSDINSTQICANRPSSGVARESTREKAWDSQNLTKSREVSPTFGEKKIPC